MAKQLTKETAIKRIKSSKVLFIIGLLAILVHHVLSLLIVISLYHTLIASMSYLANSDEENSELSDAEIALITKNALFTKIVRIIVFVTSGLSVFGAVTSKDEIEQILMNNDVFSASSATMLFVAVCVLSISVNAAYAWYVNKKTKEVISFVEAE